METIFLQGLAVGMFAGAFITLICHEVLRKIHGVVTCNLECCHRSETNY